MALIVYARGADGRVALAADPHAALADGSALWIDLLTPTAAEEALVEGVLRVDAPTQAEREALEESARFYEEDGALHLACSVVAGRGDGRGDGRAQRATATFVLARGRLLTIRTCTPKAFEIGRDRASVRIEQARDAADVLMALLESLVERLADHLSRAVDDLEAASRAISAADDANYKPDAQVRALAAVGAFAAHARDALGSLGRLAAYARGVADRHGLPAGRLRALARDVDSLERQAESLSSDLTFLLDAVLGLVSTAQNRVMKATAVATLFFLPPTLVASVFGMNFEEMTIFKAPHGAWGAVAAMLATSAALYAVARWRKWL